MFKQCICISAASLHLWLCDICLPSTTLRYNFRNGNNSQNRIEYSMHSVIAGLKFLNDSFCHIHSPRLCMQWRFSVIEAQIRVWMAHVMLFSSGCKVSNIGIEILQHIWLFMRLQIKLPLFDAGVASNGNSLLAILFLYLPCIAANCTAICFMEDINAYYLYENFNLWELVLAFQNLSSISENPALWQRTENMVDDEPTEQHASSVHKKHFLAFHLHFILSGFPKLMCKVFAWNLVSMSSYHIFVAIQYDIRWRILLHSVFQITSGCMKPNIS